MQYQEILHRCFRCGFCKMPSDYSDINCPAYLKYRFESFSPGGRMWLIRAWLDNELQNTPRLQEILFSCATCNNCVEHCIFPKFKDYILEAFTAAKEEMVEQGTLPPRVRDYLTTLFEHGNPYKIPQKKRGDWANEHPISMYSDQEYLFYVGDVGSHENRGSRIARATSGLLQRLGASIGILGSKEGSDGNEAKYLGENELFRHLAEQNINTFNKFGVEKIVALSPHAYNVLKNDYPELGGSFQVLHYTHLLADLLRTASLPENLAPIKLTFHDSCYLGRHNQDYDTVRNILNALPGTEFVEMKRNKGNSLCCGGGGGNFFTGFLSSGMENSANTRVREAADTGADYLLTSCPVCTIMLQEALKSQNLEHKIQVREISELILEHFFQYNID